jgi:hypothetical protein
LAEDGFPPDQNLKGIPMMMNTRKREKITTKKYKYKYKYKPKYKHKYKYKYKNNHEGTFDLNL